MWSGLILSNIIRYSSRQDIYSLCLLDKKSYEKIYKNGELFRALVKVDFNKDGIVGINPVKYYLDNRLSLYGISNSQSSLTCLPSQIKGDDGLVKIWSGAKFVSTTGNMTGFITAENNLYVCGWPFETTGFVLLRTNVKLIVCVQSVVAVLSEDEKLYIYLGDDKFVLVLSNVRHIQKDWTKGFNAITDGGEFYTITSDTLLSNFVSLDFMDLIEAEDIQFSARYAGEIDKEYGKIFIYKITLKINQIKQNIKSFNGIYLITESGFLYRIREDYSGSIRFKKLDTNVLFMTRLNNYSYWVNSLNQLILQGKGIQQIVHAFEHPIITVISGSMDYIGFLDNIGNFYILGKPEFLFPAVAVKKYYSYPILVLTKVRQLDLTSGSLFCIIEN